MQLFEPIVTTYYVRVELDPQKHLITAHAWMQYLHMNLKFGTLVVLLDPP